MRIRALVATVTAATAVSVLGTFPASAAYPGTNGVIAYDYWPSGAAGTQIFTVAPGTGVITNLSRANTSDDQPAISPNGKKIAFRHGGDIWVMSNAGYHRVDLTPGLHNGSQPSWSPDGTKIVFNDNNDLAVMTATGAKLHTILTESDSTDPVWSPDGSRIAFVWTRTGSAQIWTVSPGGFSAHNVSRADRYTENQPDWSPDGTRLAFSTNRSDDGLRQIFASNASGTVKTQLVDARPSGSYSPAYAPDGTMFAYTENVEGSVHIALNTAGDITPALQGTSVDDLSWGPAPSA